MLPQMFKFKYLGDVFPRYTATLSEDGTEYHITWDNPIKTYDSYLSLSKAKIEHRIKVGQYVLGS